MLHAYIFGFLSVGAIAAFTFVSVAAWADARRREREALYKSETMKKFAESPAGAAAAIEMLREEARIAARRRRESQRLGGLITLGIGVGTWIFLQQLVRNEPVYLAGVIPIIVGGMLLLYSYLLAPKTE